MLSPKPLKNLFPLKFFFKLIWPCMSQFSHFYSPSHYSISFDRISLVSLLILSPFDGFIISFIFLPRSYKFVFYVFIFFSLFSPWLFTLPLFFFVIFLHTCDCNLKCVCVRWLMTEYLLATGSQKSFVLI